MTTRKNRLVPRPLAQTLEPRRLLSAGGNIDTSFGNNGYLNGYRAEGLAGGSIVAQTNGAAPFFPDGEQVLASPDGKSIQPYGGPIPQPPAQNVQSNGKYLILADGAVSRFNANGTVDTTFGNNGTVTEFGDGDPNHLFQPEEVLVNGNQIYLAGSLEHLSDSQKFPAVERLTSSGLVDSAYGSHGIAISEGVDGSFPIEQSVSRFGPDGELYITWDNDEAPVIIRFSQTGVVDGVYVVSLDARFSNSVFGLQFEPDQKILVLAAPSSTNVELIRLNHDMTPDPSFGQNGIVPVDPPTPHDASEDAEGTLLLRADGEIIASVALFDGLDYTEVFKRDVVANSGTISGRFFNDINGNRKQEKNEPGLAYWQAYADLNNNGVYDTGEPSGFANAHGDYSISGLAPGTYVIREVRQDGWTRTTPAGAWPLGFYKVTVKANQTVSGLNFGNSIPNHAKGSISGTIFNDINGDQIQDNGEPALVGWQAYVDVNDNGVWDKGEPIATADKNGHYVIDGLPTGGYVVREIRHNGWSRTTPPGDWPLGFNEVNLAPGQNSTGNNFGNVHARSALVSVSGIVYNDINGNGQLDPGETGLGEVRVLLYNTIITSVPWIVSSTAADGSFAFDNLPPGTYFLDVGDFDSGSGWEVVTDPFTLLPGQSFHQNFFDHAT